MVRKTVTEFFTKYWKVLKDLGKELLEFVVDKAQENYEEWQQKRERVRDQVDAEGAAGTPTKEEEKDYQGGRAGEHTQDRQPKEEWVDHTCQDSTKDMPQVNCEEPVQDMEIENPFC